MTATTEMTTEMTTELGSGGALRNLGRDVFGLVRRDVGGAYRRLGRHPFAARAGRSAAALGDRTRVPACVLRLRRLARASKELKAFFAVPANHYDGAMGVAHHPFRDAA